MKKKLPFLKNAIVSCMLITFTMQVFSQTATAPSLGDGTEGSPYEIATLDNLYWLSQNSAEWGKYFIQTADIDASATVSWDSGAGFSPIGSNTSNFTGSYNGKGHVVDSLVINRSGTSLIGFFGVSSGVIDSLGLSNVSIKGKEVVGAIAGANLGSIKRCYSTGYTHMSGYNSAGGGFVGQNGGYLKAGTIRDCFTTATVHGRHMIGGLVGNNFPDGKIYNSYSVGEVITSLSDPMMGGLLGANSGGYIGGCYWDTETSGQPTSAGGSGRTTAQMKTKSTFSGWSFTCDGGSDNAWSINNTGSGYPFLAWQGIYFDSEPLSELSGDCSVIVSEYPEVADTCGQPIVATTSDPIEYNGAGTYYINWTYDLGEGKTMSQIQTINVLDDESPVPDVADLTAAVEECAATITNTPTATDNCMGSITGTTTDPLTYNEIGNYTITWTYNDGLNEITQEQIVIVQADDTDPEFTCIDDQSVNIQNTNIYTVSGNEFDPEVIDNCDLESVVNDFNNGATLDGAEFPVGTTTVTWTATDATGNSSQCTYNLIISNTTVINSFEDIGISIYPNPVNGILHIEFGEENVQRLTISDITGRIIIDKIDVNKSEQIDISEFDSGVYLVNVFNDKIVHTNKIIKQ